MSYSVLNGATLGRALAFLTSIALAFLAGCSGGGGSSAPASNFAPPPPGGGGGGGNTAPTITSTAPTTATVGVLYSYQGNANDVDGDPLSWSLPTKPTGMVVSATGLVTWTPTSGQVGAHSVTLQVSDGTATAQQSWTVTVSAAGGGGGLPASVTLADLGALPNGMLVLSDMVEFDGKLFIAAAQMPLGSPFGAGIYTYNGTSIGTAFYDSASQGFLRAKVYDNKLYIPDGDPNGLDPGKVYIWSVGSTSPLATNVTGAVHNFDVVKFNNELYVSGSNNSGQSTLHRYNSSTSTWTQVSAGGYTRLKYMGVLDNKIWCSKSVASGTDGVWVDAALTQTGFLASSGGGNLISCIEDIEGKLYMSMWGSAVGVMNFRVSAGSSTTACAGISGLMWDIVKHTDGNYYAVAWDGTNDKIYGSTDGTNFTELYSAAGSKFGQPGNNADGRPSIASYNGKLYVGSSTNGRLYRLD